MSIIAHPGPADQDVQHDHELAEDEHPVTLRLEPGEELVEEQQFARTVDQLLQPLAGVPAIWLRHFSWDLNSSPDNLVLGGLVDELHVVAGLPQLHHDVHQAHLVLAPG